MALFGKKKDTAAAAAADTTAPAVTVEGSAAAEAGTERSAASVLLRPHITEKAFGLSQRNVYTFAVSPTANKYQVAKAVKDLYNVTPEKVNVTQKQPRKERSLLRNRTSHKPGLKKAYVYLKEGDTINFM